MTLPDPDTTIVTGGGGWLGRTLLHTFAAAAAPHRRGAIRALVRTEAEGRAVAAIGPTVTSIVGDVTDPCSLRALFDRAGGVTDVIHTAGVIHPRRTSEFDLVNADGTRNMLAAAADRGVRRFVHVSSISAFGANPVASDPFRHHEPFRPYLGYGRSKMEAELAVAAWVERGLDAVVVRAPWFYGPHQPARQSAFFRLVRRGLFPVVGDGRQIRSMVYLDNLVDGIVRAELVPAAAGRAWWVADARPYTVTEITDTVGAALAAEGFEVSAPRVRLPAVAGRMAATADRAIQATGWYQQQLHVLGELGHDISCDISATRRDLGYEPAVDLAEGMRRSIRWCKANGVAL